MSLYSILSKAFTKKPVVQSDLDKDRGLAVVVTVMVFGFLGILIVGFWAISIPAPRSFWAVVGLSGVVGLAAMFTGGILGFLFGIPRSLQRTVDVPNGEENGNGNVRPYSNNTNLEQISDWLTKIIVGVGLTQLPAIQRNFNELVLSVSSGFTGFIEAKYAYPYSSALIIFYTICGFLAVYIWAKVYFMEQLTILEDKLNKRNIRMEVKENTERSLKLDIARLENMRTEFNRAKNRVQGIENLPTWKPIIDKAAPGPIKYIDDFQKERWGGKAEADGYKAEATIDPKKKRYGNYLVDITVKPVKPGLTLTGLVYFFQHQSYIDQEYIMAVSAVNNIATIEIASYEAFTMGIYIDSANVKLELDLNLCDIPEDYKYSSPLLTYDDVMGELESVKAESAKKGVTQTDKMKSK